MKGSGKARATLVEIKRVLTARKRPAALAWDLWLELSWPQRRREPKAVLAFLKPFAAGDLPASIIDLRWVLAQLAETKTLRIKCGTTEDLTDSRGNVWSADRLYAGGRPGGRSSSSHQGEIQGTDQDAIYRWERYFPGSDQEYCGYRVPLPPGRYRITLHFAEIHFKEPGKRIFDVLLEGEKVLEGYEPRKAGFAVADPRTFTRSVTDGVLEVEFRHRAENPKLSALEITRVGD